MQFENVTVVAKANVYFDGAVTSRTVLFADGSKKTLGIMMPGTYDFGTDCHETMEILSGELTVDLGDGSAPQTIVGTGVFEVEGGKRFKVDVKTVTDYCCSYR